MNFKLSTHTEGNYSSGHRETKETKMDGCAILREVAGSLMLVFIELTDGMRTTLMVTGKG